MVLVSIVQVYYSAGLIGIFDQYDRPSADHQTAPISGRASGARPFRQGGRRLLRHPVDALGGAARAGDPARHDAGRAHAARGPLHRARREDRRQGGARPARGRRAGRDGARGGPAAARRAADGRHPDHRAVPAPGDAAAAARANGRASSSTCARRPARPRARRCIAASSTACCSPSPSPAATSIPRRCSTTRCSSPSRRARRRAATPVEVGRDRREPHAPPRGRPLPQGPCAVGLQPPRSARARGDDGHLAAHAGADGRQRPRPDLHPGNGDRGRDPRRHPRRREAAQLRSRLPPHRPDLAPVQPARERVPAARGRRCAGSCATCIPGIGAVERTTAPAASSRR